MPVVLLQIIVQEADWGAITEPIPTQVILLEELQIMELGVTLQDTPRKPNTSSFSTGSRSSGTRSSSLSTGSR